MAVITIPDGCYKQPNDTESVDENNNKTFSVDIKGPFESIRQWVRGISIGTDTLDDHVVKSSSIRRESGNLATATLTLGDPDGQTSGETPEKMAYKGVWSFHASRNDASILVYCANPQERIHIELWQKETDGTLADAYKYKDDSGTEHALSQSEKKIAQKIGVGIESVVRFHPILTFTSYYKTCPDNWGVDLGLIRTPAAAAADKVVAPNNINSVLTGFQWLKMQDDVDEQPDNTFKRVQSWWGIREDEGGWDEDLYGASRWQIGGSTT